MRILLERAVAEATSLGEDNDAYWDAVSRLQQADPDEVWPLVSGLAAHRDARVRALVPDVLRFLGGEPQPRREDTVQLFRDMLETERAPNVIASIASAFVDLRHPAAVEMLRPFANHADPRIRACVVHGWLPVARDVVPELIVLSRDSDDEVRDWATFGLGSQLGLKGEPDLVDTPELREALVRRLDDPQEETRAEATLGLALRGDARAIPVIERELANGSDWSHYAEAAELLKSS